VLIDADATDPSAIGNATAALATVTGRAPTATCRPSCGRRQRRPRSSS